MAPHLTPKLVSSSDMNLRQGDVGVVAELSKAQHLERKLTEYTKTKRFLVSPLPEQCNYEQF